MRPGHPYPAVVRWLDSRKVNHGWDTAENVVSEARSDSLEIISPCWILDQTPRHITVCFHLGVDLGNASDPSIIPRCAILEIRKLDLPRRFWPTP